MATNQEPTGANSLKLAQEFYEQAKNLLDTETEDPKQAANILRHALEALAIKSTETAWGIREAIGDQWMRIVVQFPDLMEATVYLREGTERFAGLPIAIKFATMRSHTNQVLEIRDILGSPKNKAWPDFFESRDGQSQLTKISTTLETLLTNEPWPNLKIHIEEIRQYLIEEALPNYIQQLSLQAYAHSRNQELALAQQTIIFTSKFVPEIWSSRVKVDSILEDLERLKTALDSRSRIEVAYWSWLVRLIEHQASFQDVLDEVDIPLPEHPDVYIDDLINLNADFRLATRVEKLLEILFSAEFYHIQGTDWETAQNTDFIILNGVPVFLLATDPRLGNLLQNRFARLIEQVKQVPETIFHQLEEAWVEITEGGYVPNASLLINNYWRVKWAIHTGIIKNPQIISSCQAILKKIPSSIQPQFDYVIQNFEAMSTKDDIAKVTDDLQNLIAINKGLSQFPAINYHNVPDPLTVVDTTVQKIPPIYLASLQQVLQSWNKLNQEGDIYQDKTAALIVLEKISGGVGQVLVDLEILKEDIWPGLELPDWDSDSSLESIKPCAEIFLEVVEEAKEIILNLPVKRPAETAPLLQSYLDKVKNQKIKDANHWLLEFQQERFLNQIQQLNNQAVDIIDQQLVDIINTQQDAPEKIQEDILSQANSEQSAKFLAERLRGLVEIKSLRYDSSKVWKIIQRGTKPGKWQNQISKEVAKEWKNLYREAKTSVRKIFVEKNQRVLNISISAFLIIVVTGSWFAFGASNLNWQGLFSVSNSSGESERLGLTLTVQNEEVTRLAAANQQATSTIDMPATGTSMAIAEASATQIALSAQTATAQANSTLEVIAAQHAAATADAQTTLCQQGLGHSYELISGPIFSPPLGSYYVESTTPFPITVAWDIQNNGICAWEQLTLQSMIGGETSFLNPTIQFWREGSASTISTDEPVTSDEIVQVILRFDVQEAQSLTPEDWILVTNGYQLTDNAVLSFDPSGWITPVIPPSSRP